MKVTSKANCIGGTERNWADVERIWNKAHSQLDSEKTEKKVTLYSPAWYNARLVSLEGASFCTLFTKEDDEYDLGLGKWGVGIDSTACDVRPFNNFVEDWESETINENRNLSQFKLFEKYKLICFLDDDEVAESFDGLFRIIVNNLEWVKRSKETTSGWRVLAQSQLRRGRR